MSKHVVREELEDDLLDEAIEICKGCKSVSPFMFQRLLSINEPRAMRIFQQLEDLQILKDVAYEEIMGDNVLLGTVDPKKIRELTLN